MNVNGKPLISNIISSVENQASTSILITDNNKDSLNELVIVDSEDLITISEKQMAKLIVE